MEIVANKHVVDRSSWCRALECRVVCNHAGHAVKASIAVPSDTDVPIVVRYVVDKPLDRVVGIATLVNVAFATLLVDVWRHVTKLAL